MVKLCIYPYTSESRTLISLFSGLEDLEYEIVGICHPLLTDDVPAIKIYHNIIDCIDEVDGIIVPDYNSSKDIVTTEEVEEFIRQGKTIISFNDKIIGEGIVNKNMYRNSTMLMECPIQIPAIYLYSEVDQISNYQLSYKILQYLKRVGLNIAVISPSKFTEVMEDYYRIPDFLYADYISSRVKVKMIRQYMSGIIANKRYDAIIVDISGGVLKHDENDDFDFILLELQEAFPPDYTIVQILAEDYLDMVITKNAIELRLRGRINAFLMSNIFFDIVKYKQNEGKRYIELSPTTVSKLAEKANGKSTIPIFSSYNIDELAQSIIDELSENIGDCRKVDFYEFN